MSLADLSIDKVHCCYFDGGNPEITTGQRNRYIYMKEGAKCVFHINYGKHFVRAGVTKFYMNSGRSIYHESGGSKVVCFVCCLSHIN